MILCIIWIFLPSFNTVFNINFNFGIGILIFTLWHFWLEESPRVNLLNLFLCELYSNCFTKRTINKSLLIYRINFIYFTYFLLFSQHNTPNNSIVSCTTTLKHPWIQVWSACHHNQQLLSHVCILFSKNQFKEITMSTPLNGFPYPSQICLFTILTMFYKQILFLSFC